LKIAPKYLSVFFKTGLSKHFHFQAVASSTRQKLRTLEGIREAYVLAWRRSVPKLHRPELENFQTHQVFVIGGGGLVSEITDIFRRHPAGHEQRLRIRQLGRLP
jgi:hypothetical protein